MITEITKAQLLCLRLGQLKDEGKARAQQISMAKMNNVQMALDTARLARDIMGAAGIVDEHPIIRHMMNLETVNTYEGTHDIHTPIVGRVITGLDAFGMRSEEHTSELQSLTNLVCRLLLEKKKNNTRASNQ